MSFVVTARKWRPKRFDEVVGQEHISRTLKNAILNERTAHAYIFAGPRGVGKTTTARILAKAVNCLNLTHGEPCNECDMCKAFASSQSLDIIEIDGASNRRIEEIRQLRESVKYAPTKGKYKVYIIDEVHMLTNESFNALLKTLEEPPEHTIFIFATTDIHKVPLTIISRCQRYDFRRIELDTIKKTLANIAEAEKIKIDDQSLTLIAKKADGALRDAQSLFDQVVSFCGDNVELETISTMLNLIDEEIYFTVSDSILDKNFRAAFDVSQTVYDNGWNFIDFLNGLVEHFRNISTVVVRKDTKLIESAEVFKERYLEYADKFSEGDTLRILSFINKTQGELRISSNQKLKVEIALYHLIGLERSSTITDLLNKIENSVIKTDTKFDDPVKKKSNNKVSEPIPPRPEPKTIVDAEKPDDRTEKQAPPPEPEQIEKKESVKSEPEVEEDEDSEEETPPETHIKEVSFNSISLNWDGFIEFLVKQKMFAHHLVNSKPLKLDGGKLTIELEHPEDREIIQDQAKFLHDKTDEFFGKPLIFDFASTSAEPANGGSTAPPEFITSGKEDTPLVKAVKEVLGGREIG